MDRFPAYQNRASKFSFNPRSYKNWPESSTLHARVQASVGFTPLTLARMVSNPTAKDSHDLSQRKSAETSKGSVSARGLGHESILTIDQGVPEESVPTAGDLLETSSSKPTSDSKEDCVSSNLRGMAVTPGAKTRSQNPDEGVETMTLDPGDDQIVTERSAQPLTMKAVKVVGGTGSPPVAGGKPVSETEDKTISRSSLPSRTGEASTLKQSSAGIKSRSRLSGTSSSNQSTSAIRYSSSQARKSDGDDNELKAQSQSLSGRQTESPDQDHEVARQREPLIEAYSPFIADSDGSLNDARKRLHEAIEQTRKLRVAYTERVYKKYRVTLDPPPPSTEHTLEKLRSNPKSSRDQLALQLKKCRDEKDLEKREVQKITAELASASQRSDPVAAKIQAGMNADSAEQLMFVSTGLSLVILPEDSSSKIDSSMNNQSGKYDVGSGQRVKDISTAAAVAGAVILDRTRKALAIKKERDRIRGVGSSSCSESSDSYSRLSVLATSIATVDAKHRSPVDGHPSRSTVGTMRFGEHGNGATNKSLLRSLAKKKDSRSSGERAKSFYSADSKQLRARIQASMTSQTLLSLQPNAEELGNDGHLSAATMHLVECGVGNNANHSRSGQQRLKHPFPESLAARRRGMNPSLLKIELEKLPGSSQARYPLSEHLSPNVNLPPTPSRKERLDKGGHAVLGPFEACTPRAKLALESILNQFVSVGDGQNLSKQRLAEINFLHGLQNFKESRRLDEAAAVNSQRIDPTLALNVLQSVGLIKSVDSTEKEESAFSNIIDHSLFDTFEEVNRNADEAAQGRRSVAQLKSLTEKFSRSKRSFVDDFFCSDTGEHPHVKNTARKSTLDDIKGITDAQSTPIPVSESLNLSKDTFIASIRGGGEEDPKAPIDNKSPTAARPDSKRDTPSLRNGAEKGLIANTISQQNGTKPLVQRPWDGSHLSTADPYAQSSQHRSSNANSMQLSQGSSFSNSSRMPQNGRGSEMNDYMNGIAQGPYEWMGQGASAAALANTHNPLAALGMHNHQAIYSVQDRSRMIMGHGPQSASSSAAAHAHVNGQAMGAPPNGAFLGGYMQPSNQPFPHYMNPNGNLIGQVRMNNTKAPVSLVANPDLRSREKKRSPPVSNRNTPNQTTQPSAGPIAGQKRKQTLDGVGLQKKPSQLDSVGSKTNVSSPSSKKMRSSPSQIHQKNIEPQPITKNAENTSKDDSNGKKQLQSGRTDSVSSIAALRFFIPSTPQTIPENVANFVLEAAVHKAVEAFEMNAKPSQGTPLIDFIVAVGTAVPIPKALVANQLKEKMAIQTARTGLSTGLQSLTREIITATLLLWLWKNHEGCFQRAFAKSGRIDVDPECKWLISQTVETAVRALIFTVSGSSAKKGPLSTLLTANRAKGAYQKGGISSEADRLNSSGKVDLEVASIVSRSLLSSLAINVEAVSFCTMLSSFASCLLDCHFSNILPLQDQVLPEFHDLLKYLDDTRKCALQSKARERALLAALISRKATMSLPFSHAYVSSMVRAGEALGHGSLFEVVQNEDLSISTMIPYDVFTDENGAWEDPCRPSAGYTVGVTGDDLMRRAHARAMIQKSLKKLQDRHSIRGGTSLPGPYIDPPAVHSPTAQAKGSPATTPRGSVKRQRSFSEPPIQPGTGSAQATTWSLYEPRHYVPPLVWDKSDLQNSSYGKQDGSTRPRSLSTSQYGTNQDRGRNRSKSVGRSMSISSPVPSTPPEVDGSFRSTHEVKWADIAGIFQSVTPQGTAQAQKEKEQASAVRAKHIFAPAIRRIDDLEESLSDDDGEGIIEDLSDKAILERHQDVLDSMKEKMSKILDARKKFQESRRSSLKK